MCSSPGQGAGGASCETGQEWLRTDSESLDATLDSNRSTVRFRSARSTRRSSTRTAAAGPEIRPRSVGVSRMPLLDHFHPPLHGPRRWEGFHHAWATTIAQQLNLETLATGLLRRARDQSGTESGDRRRDDGTDHGTDPSADRANTAVWSPPRPKIRRPGRFRPTRFLRGPRLRGSRRCRASRGHRAGESREQGSGREPADVRREVRRLPPARHQRGGHRRRHGSRSANLHRELFEILEVKGRPARWESSTGLYAVAYRAVTVRKRPRVEVWPRGS